MLPAKIKISNKVMQKNKFKMPPQRAGISISLICSDDTVHGVHCEIRKGLICLITGITQDNSNQNQYIFAIRAVALVTFYFATHQSYRKQQTPSIFQKVLPTFQFLSLYRYPMVHTLILPKDSQEDRSTSIEVDPKLLPGEGGGSHGPMLVVAPSPC
jgi:hypothetical protein